MEEVLYRVLFNKIGFDDIDARTIYALNHSHALELAELTYPELGRPFSVQSENAVYDLTLKEIFCPYVAPGSKSDDTPDNGRTGKRKWFKEIRRRKSES